MERAYIKAVNLPVTSLSPPPEALRLSLRTWLLLAVALGVVLVHPQGWPVVRGIPKLNRSPSPRGSGFSTVGQARRRGGRRRGGSAGVSPGEERRNHLRARVRPDASTEERLRRRIASSGFANRISASSFSAG